MDWLIWQYRTNMDIANKQRLPEFNDCPKKIKNLNWWAEAPAPPSR